MKYVEFKLINSEDERIYLKGNLNLETIDDDEPEWEFEQNNGMMENRVPQYWKTFNENLTDKFEIFLESIDWDMFKQYLFDYKDEINKTINFYGDILIINKDE